MAQNKNNFLKQNGKIIRFAAEEIVIILFAFFLTLFNAGFDINKMNWVVFGFTDVFNVYCRVVATKYASDMEQEINLDIIATIAGSEELQDNAINAYLDFSQQRILVNESKGFDMFLFAALQNVVLNGETIIANVYFYDGLTGEWVEFQSAYREALNLSSFSAKNLIPQIDELWHGLTYEDDINDDPGDTPMQPTIVKPEANDSMIIADFSGAGINVDTEWSGLSLQDGATIKNLTNDNVIPV